MLDFQLGDEVTVPAQALQAPAPASAPISRQLAQGVQCGEFSLAFGFDWARQIVDEFELVPMPRAPAWVLGAVNVNGLIVPVVDLANYFSASRVPAQLQRGQRLLVGGVQAEDAEEALAVVFSQTPEQLEYEVATVDELSALPQRLQEVCRGVARGEQGRMYIEIEPKSLMNALSGELSVI